MNNKKIKYDCEDFKVYISEILYKRKIKISTFFQIVGVTSIKSVCLNYEEKKYKLSSLIDVTIEELDEKYSKLVRVLKYPKKGTQYIGIHEKVSTELRKCMKCDNLFESENKYNRLCSSCKIYAKSIYEG